MVRTHKTRILLIDDDVCEHKLVDYFLAVTFGEDYELVATVNLDHAAAVLERAEFDCILLDDQVRPFGDALSNIPRLKEVAPRTPLYVISVCEPENLESVVQAHAIDGFVDKFELKDRIKSGLFRRAVEIAA